MRYGLLLILFFVSCQNCPPEMPNIKRPEGSKDGKPGNVIVSVAGDDKLYIGTKEVAAAQFDSLLEVEISKRRNNLMDTVTVVIMADTSARYKTVFDIMRSAKKSGARVVANVR